MAYLQSKVMADGRGDRFGVIARDAPSACTLLAFCWVDRDRRYFISTCSSLAPGPPCVRQRWRQVDQTPNAPPELLEVIVPQPAACAVYYGACARIDQHNRIRQSSLMLETKHKTTLWHRRVNMSIFAMVVVDAYMLSQGCQPRRWKIAVDFFTKLSEELIDNKYEQRALRKRQARAVASGRVGNVLLPTHQNVESGVLKAEKQRCAPTQRPKKGHPSHRAQGKCMVCRMLSCRVCRLCQQAQPDPWKKQYWICQKSGMHCMGAHILKDHPAMADLSDDEDELFEVGAI
jgi:hypothetical protein